MKHLGGISGLRVLDLSGCPMTDVGLVHLQKLSSLRSLKLSQSLSREAVDQLRAAMPKCKVEQVGS